MIKIIGKRKFLLLITLSFLVLNIFLNFTLNNSNLLIFNENTSKKIDSYPKGSLNLEWNKTEINNWEGIGSDVVLDSQGNAYVTGK